MRYPTLNFTPGEKVSYKMQGRFGSFDAEVISVHPKCVRIKVYRWMGNVFNPIQVKNVGANHLQKASL